MRDHLRQAETLAETLDDQRRLARVSAYTTNHMWLIGDHTRAVESGQRALTIAASLQDFNLQISANYYLGVVYYTQGDYRRAVECLQWNVNALEGDLLHERLGLPGLASVMSRTALVWCLTELGVFAEGRGRGEEGIRIAEAVDHPFSRGGAYFSAGRLYLRQRDHQRAISVLERGLGLYQDANMPTQSPWSAAHLGYAYALSGRVAEALPLLEQAIEQSASMGQVVEHPLWLAWLSEAYLLAGRREEATQLAERALALSCDRKERGREAWALRLLGELSARRAPLAIEPAEHHYRQALALAEDLGMRPLQAHCHLGLGTLYAKTGQREQAHAELSTAIAMYRAMDMTFWLPQAEMALAQVEER